MKRNHCREEIACREQRERQIEELLAQMTLEEKISMIHGSGFFRTKAVERLGIPELVMSDGPMGVRQQFPDDSWIPVGLSDDFVSYGVSNSALAASWNPECAYLAGKTLGEEARGRGKDVILAPGINIKRDPLCGRNFEYMSEDPCLIEALAVPFIQGVQENDVAACVKHFAVNNQETNRLTVDTVVDERTLREIYYPGFRAAVQEAGSYALMNAYNKLNGFFCSENKELLNKVLREEWKYDGTVISDWGSVHSTKQAAEASLDLEMSVTADFEEYWFAKPLAEAVQRGEVREEDIDNKVRNLLRMMYRLKMIGPQAGQRKAGAYNTAEHQQGIRDIAKECILLLKNEEEVLPLTQERLQMTCGGTAEAEGAEGAQNSLQAPRRKRIAVIGRNADAVHANGGGSGEVKALYEISPLMGLKKALGGNVEILYAPGYFIPCQENESEVNWQEASLERRVMGEEQADSCQAGSYPEDSGMEEDSRSVCDGQWEALRREIEENRERLKKEACALAARADEVIFVGGLNHEYDVEGRDRADMKLPYGQDELLEELLSVHPDTIVVMVAGSPVEMPWLNRAKALVWCYYSGMETGTALADILLGRVNPSAKLPETFPVAYSDTVTARNGQFGAKDKVTYEEGVFVGYRYYEKERIQPAFPFGYGLSYTQFSMRNLKVSRTGEKGFGHSENDTFVTACVEVTNTGARAGTEVVQCYVTDCECSVERPLKELKAFQKVFLEPGETKTVTLSLPYSALAFYDVTKGDFTVEPGRFVISVGNSSDCCPLRAVLELE